MAMDPLDQVLALVAEGRLSAEEAAPILAALDEGAAGGRARGGREDVADAGTPAGGPEVGTAPGAASALRIEVRDGGRSVVNLRLPIALGRFAVDRVPGLSPDSAERVREALHRGLRGPVLEVNEQNGDGVRIVLE